MNDLIKRISALIIDMMICGLLGIIIWLLTIGIKDKTSFVYLVINSLPYALLFARDSFSVQSPGSRLSGIAVIDSRTNDIIKPFRALLRNLILVIWPVEFLVMLISGKRIGDMLFNTEVKDYHERRPMNKEGFFVILITALLIGVILHLFINSNSLFSLLFI